MRFKFIIVLLICSSVFAQEKQIFTVEHCVKLALENNGNIRSAEFESGSARHKMQSAKTERLPSLEFSGSYTRLSGIEPFSITMPIPTS